MRPLIVSHPEGVYVLDPGVRLIEHGRKKPSNEILASLAPGQPEAVRMKTGRTALRIPFGRESSRAIHAAVGT
jgi:hypothetical protein